MINKINFRIFTPLLNLIDGREILLNLFIFLNPFNKTDFNLNKENKSLSRNERNLSQRFSNTQHESNGKAVSKRLYILSESLVLAGRVSLNLFTHWNKNNCACKSLF
jgi:hypothetical protein